MAPVEFERELREKLRSRKIDPRADSWERIQARLDAKAPSRKYPGLFWKMGVAASVICLLGYFLFWSPAQVVPEGTPVVESPEPTAPARPEKGGVPVEAEAPEVLVLSPVIQAETPERNPGPDRLSPTRTALAERTGAFADKDLPARGRALVLPGLQDSTGVPVTELAEREPGEETAYGAEDAGVEALLLQAIKVVESRNMPKDTIALNPAMLLEEAEYELDQTFREQILKKLKTRFGKVRTAAADRSGYPKDKS